MTAFTKIMPMHSVKNNITFNKIPHWVFAELATLCILCIALNYISSTTSSRLQAVETNMTHLTESINTNTSENVIFLKIIILQRDVDQDVAKKLAKIVHRQAQAYQRDPDLVLALMKVESGFNPNIVSNMGAVGLMQVMPCWIKIFGITEDLTNPETSVKYGLQILNFYENMYGNLQYALTAYNAGPTFVDSSLSHHKVPNNGYADRVNKYFNQLHDLQVGD